MSVFVWFSGDEVIEWNGRSLQGKSYQEVADIIAESKQEANVELIVSRSMGSRRIAQANWRQSVAHRGMPERRDTSNDLFRSRKAPDALKVNTLYIDAV